MSDDELFLKFEFCLLLMEDRINTLSDDIIWV